MRQQVDGRVEWPVVRWIGRRLAEFRDGDAANEKVVNVEEFWSRERRGRVVQRHEPIFAVVGNWDVHIAHRNIAEAIVVKLRRQVNGPSVAFVRFRRDSDDVGDYGMVEVDVDHINLSFNAQRRDGYGDYDERGQDGEGGNHVDCLEGLHAHQIRVLNLPPRWRRRRSGSVALLRRHFSFSRNSCCPSGRHFGGSLAAASKILMESYAFQCSVNV
ncbi:Gfo/Idh/MocA family oxidoreductase [Babesia caballi]|uniref:Gfo/Idh/MocA family oxidoreductase n=1 Tax=Babesia caballi TaxID=5871 RepID=A0AAV4LZI3_BABCB|nr:Gfo/Idh/MocA family oxidoreductase [Babesia caballi]